MLPWLKALRASLRTLFSMRILNGERPETADPAHHDELQCRHCGHIHAEPDGSCACGCTLSEL